MLREYRFGMCAQDLGDITKLHTKQLLSQLTYMKICSWWRGEYCKCVNPVDNLECKSFRKKMLCLLYLWRI